VVEARYGKETAFSIPRKIEGIEAAISRLQDDIIRDAATRRGTSDPANAVSKIEASGKAPPGVLGDTARDMGNLLFQYLFDKDIEKVYRKAVKDCDGKENNLQIALTFAEDPESNPLLVAPWLNLTPWETLWDNQAKQFMATDGSTFFCRAVGGPLKSKARTPPLRVLIMAAYPQVFEGRRLGNLKGRVEVEKIRDVLRGQGCQVSVVPGESIDDLEQELFENNPARYFDVLHFIGHGDFDGDRGEGYLLFREPDGAGGAPIHADYLRNLLSQPWAPQLVVLNSCSGARGRGGDMFSSTAAFLSLGRIPAVVAMQFPITDRAAVEFSRSFYRWLGQGALVQEATRRARWKLSSLGPEWITPVLYLRNPEGRLVLRQTSAATDDSMAQV
jgi:hypothetical protein